jgi:O-antigen/teichoic acid export membrane protein
VTLLGFWGDVFLGLFGHEFEGAGALLLVLALAYGSAASLGLAGHVLAMLGETRVQVQAALVASAILPCLACWWQEHGAALGMTYAVLVAQLIQHGAVARVARAKLQELTASSNRPRE